MPLKYTPLILFITILFNSGLINPVKNNKINEHLNKAVQEILFEQQLCQMAAQKAVNQRVRDLGQTIQTDLTMIGEDLKKIMKNLNLQIPSNIDKKLQKKINKLNKKEGEEFDSAFLEIIIINNNKNIAGLSEVYLEITNADFKKWIEKVLPVIDEHKDKAGENMDILK